MLLGYQNHLPLGLEIGESVRGIEEMGWGKATQENKKLAS
jgi:hypothetical protein